MPVSFIPYTGWSPGGGYFGEGWPIAGNLYSGLGSTGRPWREFTPVGTGIAAGPMIGSFAHVWATGAGTASYTPDAQTFFAGSATDLYSVNPSTGAFTALSRGGGYAAAGTPAAWRGASVGNDPWMVNWLDVMQRRTNNAGNFANGVVSTFSPIPRFIATFREHLLVANLNQGGRFQDELAWSDADNATNFDPPTGTSTSIAGSKRLTSIPGQITGLLGGQYGLAFKRRGIYYLEATGTTQVLRPEILSDSVGTAFPSSIIRTRHGVFFRGLDGFYQIAGGLSQPTKISTPGVDEYVLRTWPPGEPGGITPWEEDGLSEAFAFSGTPLIGWGSRTTQAGFGSSGGVLYDPDSQQWGYGDLSPGFLGSALGSFLCHKGGSDAYDSVAAFTWENGTTSRYARYSTGNSDNDFQETAVELRFRPANFDALRHQAQSVIRGVLPMFSKDISFSGASAVQPTLYLDSILEPFQAAYTTEGPRLYSERDTISGFYPFQLPGRFFRIRMTVSSATFENFLGFWVDQEALT